MAAIDNLQDLISEIKGLVAGDSFKLANMIYNASEKVRDVQNTHVSFPDVRDGKEIPVLERSSKYASFPFKTSKDCNIQSCDIKTDYSSFTWNIDQIACRIDICLENFSEDFLHFYDVWVKYNEGDMFNAYIDYIVELFQENKNGAEWRVLYFGDTTSQNLLINKFDGYITQMAARAAAADARVVISENAGATVAEQTIADGERVYKLVEEMVYKASKRAWFKKDKESLVLRIDENLAEDLVWYLNTTDAKLYCNCVDPNKVTKPGIFTVDNLTMFGIQVEAIPFQQIMEEAQIGYDQDTGLFENRNIIILSRKDNMLIGYQKEETLKYFKMYLNEDTDKIVLKGRSVLGAGVPTDAFIIAI